PCSPLRFSLSLHDALPISTDDSSYPHCVGISNFQAAFDIGRKIVEFGHRDVAICGGDPSRNERARGLRNGILAALAEKGYSVRPDRKSTRLNSSHVKISYA